MSVKPGIFVIIFIFAPSPGFCSDLPTDFKIRFLKILLKSSNLPNQVACSDNQLLEELKKAGIEISPGAGVAWAKTSVEVQKLKESGKMVVCPSLDLLNSGGSIAIVEEGGKPAVYLHRKNFKESGMILGDSIFKIAKLVP